MKRISSLLTVYFKYMVIPFWVGVHFFPIIIGLPCKLSLSVTKIEMFLSLLIGLFFFYSLFGRLKEVEIGERGELKVSNFIKIYYVKLCDIEKITYTVFTIPELVWLKMRKPTPLGKTILFLPKVRFFRITRHPIIDELYKLKNEHTKSVISG